MAETLFDIAGKRFRIALRRNGDGYAATVDGRPVSFTVEEAGPGLVAVRLGRDRYVFQVDPPPPSEGAPSARPGDAGILRWRGRPLPYRVASAGDRPAATAADPVVRAHMPGLLVRVAVSPGDVVKPGDLLAILEAMKMQNEIRAKAGGRVAEVNVRAGQTLEAGAPIARIEPVA